MNWVIEWATDECATNWRPVTRAAVRQDPSHKFEYQGMLPRSFEECVQIAMREEWNPTMHFRFLNLKTGETVPFALFPDIRCHE